MKATLLYEKLRLVLGCKYSEFVAAVVRKFHCSVLDYVEHMTSRPELIMSMALGNLVDDDDDWFNTEAKWFNLLGI